MGEKLTTLGEFIIEKETSLYQTTDLLTQDMRLISVAFDFDEFQIWSELNYDNEFHNYEWFWSRNQRLNI